MDVLYYQSCLLFSIPPFLKAAAHSNSETDKDFSWDWHNKESAITTNEVIERHIWYDNQYGNMHYFVLSLAQPLNAENTWSTSNGPYGFPIQNWSQSFIVMIMIRKWSLPCTLFCMVFKTNTYIHVNPS